MTLVSLCVQIQEEQREVKAVTLRGSAGTTACEAKSGAFVNKA